MVISDHLNTFCELVDKARRARATNLYIYAQHGKLVARFKLVKNESHIKFWYLHWSGIHQGLSEADWNYVAAKIASFQRRNWLFRPTGREKPLPPCIPNETLPLFPK